MILFYVDKIEKDMLFYYIKLIYKNEKVYLTLYWDLMVNHNKINFLKINDGGILKKCLNLYLRE